MWKLAGFSNSSSRVLELMITKLNYTSAPFFFFFWFVGGRVKNLLD